MPRPADHDAYLARCEPFAVPILEKIRKAMHKACPDIEETIKWSSPHFEHNGLVGGVAAFKEHVRFVFWRGKDLQDPDGILGGIGKTDMGALRLEKASDLPSQQVLVKYIKEAVRLNAQGASAPKEAAKKSKKKGSTMQRTIAAPDDFLAALKKKRRALATFDGFSYSNRKEYVEWIEGAKREATRTSRIETAVEWLAEGKPRNWKYMKEWG